MPAPADFPYIRRMVGFQRQCACLFASDMYAEEPVILSRKREYTLLSDSHPV